MKTITIGLVAAALAIQVLVFTPVATSEHPDDQAPAISGTSI